MALYAIGMKGFVQLRIARKAPKPIKSSITRTLTLPNLFGATRWDPAVHGFRRDSSPKDVTFTTTIHEGGRVVGTLKKSKVYALTGITIRKDAVVELAPSVKEKLSCFIE